MAIRKIRVRNFKSFKDMEVELGNLNILIGANASGKSNFVEIFRSLRDIKTFGLDNAISLQGGAEYLRNTEIDPSKALSLEVVYDTGFALPSYLGYDIDTYETTYEFAIAFNGGGSGFGIVKDGLTQKCNFSKLAGQGEKAEVSQGEITVSSVDGKVATHLDAPPEVLKELGRMLPEFFLPKELPLKTLLLETQHPPLLMLLRPMSDARIAIYDFDPRLPKKYRPVVGKAELEENGENLAIVLKNIMANSDEKRKFFNLVKYLLPFIDDVSVERALDKSLLLRIRETFSKEFLPAFLISDGTINMIALVLALYFGKKSLAIIEEPERNIHPYLISKVVHMMEDASQSKLSKQIIVTTHNPEMVKHADPKNLLLISRNREGFSSISRPHDKEKVKIFLENEIGIEDLYVDSLLEI